MITTFVDIPHPTYKHFHKEHGRRGEEFFKQLAPLVIGHLAEFLYALNLATLALDERATTKSS